MARIQGAIADLGEVNIGDIIQLVESTLRGIDELANSQDVREALAGINTIINEEETQQLSGTLQAALNEFRDASSDASILLQSTDTKLETLEADLGPILTGVTGTLDEVDATLAAVRLQVEGETIESYQLNATLREVEGAARALRELMDYLDRSPEALLRGKSQ
jgi:paraquat-inducible protein B